MNDTVFVVGAGGWGTALAVLLARRGVHTRLWAHRAEHAAALRETRENRAYLPGVQLPEQIDPVDSFSTMPECGSVVFVTPSRALREVATTIAAERCVSSGAVVVSCVKSIEHGTGKRMSEILAELFPSNPIGVLSGPSHAEEVARGAPTAVVAGCADEAAALKLQALFSTPEFRVYTSDDVAGIELGGALKNIFAIAAGVADGLGLGDNTKAALVTRSLAEMIRLGEALGGRRETFQGLSGIGDLMVTCFSRHSRNRGVGERLGSGETLEAILHSMQMVAEGVPTAYSARECVQRLGVRAPVVEQVCRILEGSQSPRSALVELMTREPRSEQDAT